MRIVAFPSYLWFGMERLEELGLSVRLPKGSKILLAGGWKQHYAQEVDKNTLYALARRVLGVEEENIHEFFGAVEHPIFFNTCKKHHFHLPAYARVIIRDVRTLNLCHGGGGPGESDYPPHQRHPGDQRDDRRPGLSHPRGGLRLRIEVPLSDCFGPGGAERHHHLRRRRGGAAGKGGNAMIFAGGKILPDTELNPVLGCLEEETAQTLSGPPLEADTVLDALEALGAELEIPSIDGKVKYDMPEGTQSGTTFRLKGKGIPSINGRGRGDQYVTVYIETPRNLNKEQKEALRAFGAAMGELPSEEPEGPKGFFGKKGKKH